MSNRPPFYLNLLQIWLPVGGFVSILHRASGLLLALAIPLLLWAWQVSLASAEGYTAVQGFFAGGVGWVLRFVLVWALLHHLLAGVRHLGFDIGWGEAKLTARRSAWVVLLSALLLTVLWVLL
jgi:succinate dehydrogenase / fumarate reductase, cytochrome b subunit